MDAAGWGDWERSTNMRALPSESDAGGELPLAGGSACCSVMAQSGRTGRGGREESESRN